jgi:hypothetical protein
MIFIFISILPLPHFLSINLLLKKLVLKNLKKFSCYISVNKTITKVSYK